MKPLEYIARAYIEVGGKILLCKNVARENWYLPGGHIEGGESAPRALVRELNEELGVPATIVRFLGASENMFGPKGDQTQEINLVFEVVLDAPGGIQSQEPHIEFGWFTREEIKEMIVYPALLKDALLKRDEGGAEPLWASEGFVSQ